MHKNDPQPGSIRAKHIQADNIVTGAQIQGSNTQEAALLIQVTQQLRGGNIDADEIIAHNIISGLQYIANPSQANSEDLRNELKALRVKLEQAITDLEIPDAEDAEDARESLATAENELAKPQPNGNRVLRKLDEANSILVKSAQAAEAAGKLSAQVIRLAPIAAVIWQVAQRVFGL
jgi:hypothetical protein